MNERSRTIEFDEELDVRGLNCPLPLLRTKKILSQMKPGNVLKVLTTDPAAEIDFRVFSEATGNKILSLEKAEKHVIIFMMGKRTRGRSRNSRRRFRSPILLAARNDSLVAMCTTPRGFFACVA